MPPPPLRWGALHTLARHPRPLLRYQGVGCTLVAGPGAHGCPCVGAKWFLREVCSPQGRPNRQSAQTLGERHCHAGSHVSQYKASDAPWHVGPPNASCPRLQRNPQPTKVTGTTTIRNHKSCRGIGQKILTRERHGADSHQNRDPNLKGENTRESSMHTLFEQWRSLHRHS